MTAMLIGTCLALAALVFVLLPLFRDPLELGRPRSQATTAIPGVSAVDALREIEFDHVTGKLSDQDYTTLKASYTQQAVAAMRGTGADVVVCTVCGPRPEMGARFCSTCGRQLAA